MSSDFRNKTLSFETDKRRRPSRVNTLALQQRLYTLGIQGTTQPNHNLEPSSSTQFHSITPQSFKQALGDPSNPAFHSRPRQRRPGFSCDTCRKRRVRCDRTHPVCNRCRGKRVCTYPATHRARKKSQESSSDDSPTQPNRLVGQFRPPLTSSIRVVYRRSASPSPMHVSTLAYPSPTTPKSTTSSLVSHSSFKRQRRLSFSSDEDISTYTGFLDKESQLQLSRISQDGLLIELLAATGWQIIPIGNGVVRFETNIASMEQLRDIISTTMNILYKKGHAMNMPMSDPFGATASASKRMQIQRRLPQGISHVSLFERLAMVTRPGAWHPDMSSNLPAQQLSTDKHLMSITPMHVPHYIAHISNCALPFPMIISPVTFMQAVNKGQVNKGMLLSILGYMIPHYCFWHSWSPIGRTVHYHRECGKAYFDEANELSEDAADLAGIFQHILCISREYDRGNMQSAYLTMGVAMSLCFSLDLHLKRGYDQYTDPYEKEFAKRIFWSLWWFDTTVPQLYSSPAVIDPDEVTAEYPAILSDYDELERAKTIYMQVVIQARRLSRVLAKRMKARKPEIDEVEELQFLLEQEKDLRSYYYTNHSTLAVSHLRNSGIMSNLWKRRTLCLALVDHCVNWLSLYQRHLPPPTRTEPPSELQILALRVCSEAADCLTALFDAWFSACHLDFDCVFRPCLFHFLSSITIHKFLINSPWVPRDRVAKSIESMRLMLQLYMKTPMQNLFPKSHIVIDINNFFEKFNIVDKSQVYWMPIYDSIWNAADTEFYILRRFTNPYPQPTTLE